MVTAFGEVNLEGWKMSSFCGQSWASTSSHCWCFCEWVYLAGIFIPRIFIWSFFRNLMTAFLIFPTICLVVLLVVNLTANASGLFELFYLLWPIAKVSFACLHSFSDGWDQHFHVNLRAGWSFKKIMSSKGYLVCNGRNWVYSLLVFALGCGCLFFSW